MPNDSKITTQLAVDDPLVQDSNYRFEEDDRQYIDNQIRGIEQHLVDALIRGRHGSWFDLAGASANVVAGDVVCLASASAGTVTKAVAAALTNAKSALGVAIQAAAAGGRVFVAFGGIVPPSITGLASSLSGYVRVNTTTARLERVAALAVSDYGIGTVDLAGWMQVCVLVILTSIAGAAAGSTTQFQYNNAGSVAGSTGFTYNLGTGQVSFTSQANHGGEIRFDEAYVNPVVQPSPRTSDLATSIMTVRSQGANAGATGTNRNSGNLVLDTGAIAAGGTAGNVVISTAGTARLTIAAGTITSGVPMAFGPIPAVAGNGIRLSNTYGLYIRDSGNASDVAVIAMNASDRVDIGNATNISSVNGSVCQLFSTGGWFLYASSASTLECDGTKIAAAVPIVGNATPWGSVDAQTQVVVSTVNITLTNTQYNTKIQKFTGAPAATRTITYPLPADDAHSYIKIIWGFTTVSGLTISNGGANSVTIPAVDSPHVMLFTPAGVSRIT